MALLPDEQVINTLVQDVNKQVLSE